MEFDNKLYHPKFSKSMDKIRDHYVNMMKYTAYKYIILISFKYLNIAYKLIQYEM